MFVGFASDGTCWKDVLAMDDKTGGRQGKNVSNGGKKGQNNDG
jgi:hypothetical protein